jgi:hypothetical protein
MQRIPEYFFHENAKALRFDALLEKRIDTRKRKALRIPKYY